MNQEATATEQQRQSSYRRVLTDSEMAAIDWRPVPGFPGLQIGHDGAIRVRNRSDDGWTFPQVCQAPPIRGYPIISVWDGKKFTPKKVHGLVAMAWLGKRPQGQVVRHLDHDRWNWRPSNLAYGSYRDNFNDAMDAGRHPFAKLGRAKAGDMRREYRPRPGEVRRLAKKFGISQSSVMDCLRGKSYPDATPSKAEKYPARTNS